MSLAKILRWCASFLRVLVLRIRLGSRVSWPKGGKPVYIGRNARIRVEKGARLTIGSGFHLSRNALVWVNPGAQAKIGKHVFMNANVMIVAAESIEIGDGVMFGPNVGVYDHDHVFDTEGVHAQLVAAPVVIGSHCWLGANVLVTRGCFIVDKTLVGGGSVVTRSLEEPGMYAGAPARLLKRFVSDKGVSSNGTDEGDSKFKLESCE